MNSPDSKTPDDGIPYPDRWCQCKTPLPSGSLNFGVEVCLWCSYKIEVAK